MLTDTKIAAIKPPSSGQEEHPDHKVTGLRLRVGAGGKKSCAFKQACDHWIGALADQSAESLCYARILLGEIASLLVQ